ncbi:hypothetical protein HDV05_005420 [Chytridiales sp. JEL 0842]|nr:hypothetical protein HDV05_005420 [Chytridiales sp. JEL 0842]
MTASSEDPSIVKLGPPPIIILIRHGEKLEWPQGKPPTDLSTAKALFIDHHRLSAKGVERSYALVGYFARRKEMVELFERQPLAAVIAQGVDSSGPGKSERPRLTVEPFFKILQLDSESLWNAASAEEDATKKKRGKQHMAQHVKFLEYKKSHVKDMVQRITSGEFNGKSVVISWSHQQLPSLAVAFGAPPSSVPGKWGKRYDVTWVLESDGKDEFLLKQYPQLLIYGDEDSVISIGKGYRGSYDEALSLNEPEED